MFAARKGIGLGLFCVPVHRKDENALDFSKVSDHFRQALNGPKPYSLVFRVTAFANETEDLNHKPICETIVVFVDSILFLMVIGWLYACQSESECRI